MAASSALHSQTAVAAEALLNWFERRRRKKGSGAGGSGARWETE